MRVLYIYGNEIFIRARLLLCVCSIESYVWVDNVVLMRRYIANAFQFDKNISLLAIKPVIFFIQPFDR